MQPAVSSSYVLLSPLSAVRLEEQPEAQSGFCVLPEGVTVGISGDSSITGLVDIVCDGAKYGVFLTDLEERGKPLAALKAEHSGIRVRIPE